MPKKEEQREEQKPRDEEMEGSDHTAEDGRATSQASVQTQTTEADVETRERELEEKDRQLKETIDRLKRLQADFENYKKRVARERSEDAQRIEDRILLEMLPIYDSFDRAFRSYSHNGDEESFIEGMERVFAQFNDFLRGLDVHPIEAKGKSFDPSLHEALMSVESEEAEPNTVLEVFETGYVRGDRIIRPSRVKVSRKPKPASGSERGDSPAHRTDSRTEQQGGKS